MSLVPLDEVSALAMVWSFITMSLPCENLPVNMPFRVWVRLAIGFECLSELVLVKFFNVMFGDCVNNFFFSASLKFDA